ncbi:MAG: M28 family peptidase [Balneolaceae bacterium]|nr:M28 family peptidase [Balneolaceae bacterium]
MKRILISCLLGGISFAWSAVAPASAQTSTPGSLTSALLSYQDVISVDYLKKHLSAFAADSMEGRDTGTPGQKKAARYLVAEYEKLGLQGVGDNQSYYQKFELSADKRDSTVFEVYRINGQKRLVDRSVESRNSSGHFIRSFGGSDTLSGEIVFAGFGVNDSDRGVTHLEGRDLNGKWVMVFQEIPAIAGGDTLIDPSIDARERFRTILGQKQAAGMLVVPLMTEEEFEATAGRYQLVYDEPGNMSLKYLKEDSDGAFSGGYNTIKPSLAAEILGVDGGIEGLARLKTSILNDITGFTPRTTGYFLTHTPHITEVTVETENIAALLEGADDSLKEEVVVLTSHYDHVGIGQPDSTGDRIYNGADDDGSGTVALLNIAKALAQARADGYAPRRSILFLHVTAEEVGLLGSRYYSDHPIIPMEKTVANINIDMIGRIDAKHEKEGITDYAYIIGSEIISSELDSLLKVANANSGQIELDKSYNDLEDPNQFYRRSDHWNFGRFGVPFIFFFTGVHEDYHRPSDEVDKIRFEKMSEIIRTIYATTVTVANETDRPTVDNQEFIEITKSNPR